MKTILNSIFYSCFLFLLTACSDDDTFSLSSSNLLTFSTDTVQLDTVFSKVPTSTRTFWVYNKSSDGIRCSSVRLERGNQTGFRVNVDGLYLGQSQGFQTSDIEIRKNDSIRVFVELTSPTNNQDTPQLVEDNLIFVHESGNVQRVNLRAMSWDADMLTNLVVSTDSVISTTRPTIIYGGITIEKGATLTIDKGTTLYFHDKAAIDVYGTLRCVGEADHNVTLRGDRIDRMFDYLPYDNVSGQWGGIHFYESSYDNLIDFTDIHGCFDAIVCDSSDVNKLKLTLRNSIIHNSQGYGLKSINSFVNVENCQITNSLNDCVAIFGGSANINQSTIAQFYPFDASRGAALLFTNYLDETDLPLIGFSCTNSIVTGYSDDVITGARRDSIADFNYTFSHCLLRTPTPSDTSHFVGVIWELPEDTITGGTKNFKNIDTDLLRYDFRLSERSKAISSADKLQATDFDRLGFKRDDEPDMGCYEYFYSE